MITKEQLLELGFKYWTDTVVFMIIDGTLKLFYSSNNTWWIELEGVDIELKNNQTIEEIQTLIKILSNGK